MSAWSALMEEMAQTLIDAYAGVQFAGMDLAVQIEPRLVINPTPPCIDIYPGETPSRGTESAGFNASGDDGEIVFTVRARVGTADNDAGQDLLVAFMDPEDELCIALPLMDDPTLGGLASSLSVGEPTGFGFYPNLRGDGALLGVQWPVTVINAFS